MSCSSILLVDNHKFPQAFSVIMAENVCIDDTASIKAAHGITPGIRKSHMSILCLFFKEFNTCCDWLFDAWDCMVEYSLDHVWYIKDYDYWL